MAQTRFVEPANSAFGSRRAWKRHRRATRHRGWLRTDEQQQYDAPSLGTVALASIVVLAVIVVAGLVLTQVASAILG